MNLADAILSPIALALISLIVFRDVRYMIRKRASDNWPTTQATIEKATLGSRGFAPALPRLIYRIHFTYTYGLNGTQYTGLFVLLTGNKKSGKRFRKPLLGRELSLDTILVA